MLLNIFYLSREKREKQLQRFGRAKHSSIWNILEDVCTVHDGYVASYVDTEIHRDPHAYEGVFADVHTSCKNAATSKMGVRSDDAVMRYNCAAIDDAIFPKLRFRTNNGSRENLVCLFHFGGRLNHCARM